MPRSYTSNDETREKKILHAPWWSDTFTTDGNPNSPECDEEHGGIPVERCVVFARRLHIDDEAVNRRVFGTMEAPKPGQKIDTSMTAKTPTYLMQQMIVELTDDEGHPAPMLNIIGKRPLLSEAFIKGMDKRDTDYIIQQLDALNEAPVPVMEKDEEEAAKRNAARQDKLDRGFPGARIDPLVSPEEIAQDDFRTYR